MNNEAAFGVFGRTYAELRIARENLEAVVCGGHTDEIDSAEEMYLPWVVAECITIVDFVIHAMCWVPELKLNGRDLTHPASQDAVRQYLRKAIRDSNFAAREKNLTQETLMSDGTITEKEFTAALGTFLKQLGETANLGACIEDTQAALKLVTRRVALINDEIDYYLSEGKK